MRELTWTKAVREAREALCPRSGERATGVVGYGLRDFGDEMSP